ncbi:MAG: CBS domain-containing protein [Verrucomicrobia bacterium]|nr:CBS domain-containing protein [Verrucomicrobiota bacterium]
MNLLLGTVAAFFAIVVGIVVLRIKGGDRFEVKTPDILLALIPIAIWLVLTNKVKVIEFGGFKIEAALMEAATASIESQVTAVRTNLPVELLQSGGKGSLDEIPRLIENKTEALIFTLGSDYYVGSAVATYLQRLSEKPFFKHIVVLRPDNSFVGLANGREFAAVVGSRATQADDFVKWLKNSDTDGLAKLLPGYVSATEAVQQDADRLAALERMEKLNLEVLPVVARAGKLAGVVSRSRLVSGLLSEVVRKVR